MTSVFYTAARRIALWSALALVVSAVLASLCWGQSAPQCVGPNKEPHSYGNFTFETNSRVERMPYRQFKSGIVSCVANNDQEYPVYVRWLIPGPRGWVPPKGRGILESAPRLIANDKLIQMTGCLEYGNRGDMTRAHFFGTARDQTAIDDEGARGCREVAAGLKVDGRSTLENIILKIKNFFPSDGNNPRSTLLQLEGYVGIRPTEPNQYTSFFIYQIRRFEGSPDGIATDVSFRPAFRGPTEPLLPFFQKENSENIRINENGEGEVSFVVTNVQNPILHYASYEILDRNRQIVGTIDFPVFVSSSRDPQRPPNIVFIMGDSIGWANVGVYNDGIMASRTPNLDKLATEGTRFTDYYAETSSVAGRSSFLTGQHPLRTGLSSVNWAGALSGIQAEDPTIATVLKSMGYSTGQFGKNNLGDRNEFLPTLHGFDEFFGYLYSLTMMESSCQQTYPPAIKATAGPRNMLHTWATEIDDPTIHPSWGKVGKQRIEDAGELCAKRMETVDDEILSNALAFIDKAKRDNKPFFVWLNPTRMGLVTHLSEKYESRRTPDNGWSIYEAGISQLDDIVGSVMQKIEDLGIEDDTIIAFSSDTGPESFTWPDSGKTPFAGGKGTVFEGGFRVPMIIRWPGIVPAGKVENAIVSGLDWFPTFVAAAGNPNISRELKGGKRIGDRIYKVHLDGFNQTDLISGKGPSNRNAIFYFVAETPAAIRINDIKVRFVDQPNEQFAPLQQLRLPIMTNLRLDPYERIGLTQSLGYVNWYNHETWRGASITQELEKFLKTFEAFPPRQNAASFSLSQILEMVSRNIARENQR